MSAGCMQGALVYSCGWLLRLLRLLLLLLLPPLLRLLLRARLRVADGVWLSC